MKWVSVRTTWIAVLMFVSLVAAPTFSVVHAATSSMSSMDNCPFMHDATLCTMDALAHISAIESMLAMPGLKVVFAIVLAIAAAVFIARSSRVQALQRTLRIESVRYRYRERTSLSIVNELELAFSSGILNPKTF